MSSEECGEQAKCPSRHGSGGYFILFTVLVSLVVIAFGFARSNVLAGTGWSSTMAAQAGLLAVSSLFFVAIALARRENLEDWRRSEPIGVRRGFSGGGVRTKSHVRHRSFCCSRRRCLAVGYR